MAKLTDKQSTACADALLLTECNKSAERSENRRIAELMDNRNWRMTRVAGAFVGGVIGFVVWRSFWPTLYAASAGLVVGAVLVLAIGYVKHRRIARSDNAT